MMMMYGQRFTIWKANVSLNPTTGVLFNQLQPNTAFWAIFNRCFAFDFKQRRHILAPPVVFAGRTDGRAGGNLTLTNKTVCKKFAIKPIGGCFLLILYSWISQFSGCVINWPGRRVLRLAFGRNIDLASNSRWLPRDPRMSLLHWGTITKWQPVCSCPETTTDLNYKFQVIC